MNINLNKDKFKDIESKMAAIQELLRADDNLQKSDVDLTYQNERTTKLTKEMSDILHEVFKDMTFDVKLSKLLDESELFIMSVFPEMSTIDKIVNAVLTNKPDSAISELWKKNKNWYIEIDQSIFVDKALDFDEKELTALLLHELGHIVATNSIPNRISTIMKYEIAKANYTVKGLARQTLFAKILSLPILDSCVSDKSRTLNNVKEEIKADNFARKMGYTNELYSALTKISKSNKIRSNRTSDVQKLTRLGIDTLDQIQKRREAIAKQTLTKLAESCNSFYISNVITEYVHDMFENESYSKYPKGHKLEIIREKMDEAIETYVNETFGVKDLKRIDPVSIDYIQVQISSIKNENDKMMLLTYAYSKLDMVNYYLDILDNPKLSKRYNVPNSKEQLLLFKKRINDCIGKILVYKYPDKYKGVLVAWPTGYEG